MKRRLLMFFMILALAAPVLASKAVVPTGDPKARKGGQISVVTTEFPKSFNYYVNNASDAALVFGMLYESLVAFDPKTLEPQPQLAESWTISLDKKEFTFKINPKARWADGTPVTAEDVKFTYDTIMDPKNLTSVHRLFLSRFEPPQLLDRMTIRFRAKNVHYNNFITLAGLSILPRKGFAGKDFNKAFTMSLPPGSGPYTLSEVKEGRYYILRRRTDYWGSYLPLNTGAYNFDRIRFRIIKNDKAAFESFKRGDFDLFVENQAKRWVAETNSVQFQQNWIVKRKVFNYEPQGIQGLVFNMRRPIFQDRRVRLAIAHLMDRDTLIQKLMYNEYVPLRSYWPSLANSKPNPIIAYDPARAKRLLAEAGYNRTDKDGFLINAKGQRMEFTVTYVSDAFERHLTVFKEDCAKAGVKVNLELISWAALLKKADNYSFDSMVMAWSGSLFPDPEQLWHSRHRSEPGGSNLPGYNNPEVDRLIEELPPIFDVKKREAIIRRIDGIIYQDTPYILFWGANYNRIYYWDKFGMPKTVFSRIGRWSDALAYWWNDPVKEQKLKAAVKQKKALPKTPVEVYYDASLKP